MWFTKKHTKKRIYLDYASAAPIAPDALRAMHAAEGLIGNPGAIHAEGVAAKQALEKARNDLAKELACKAREIVFTSGLTEANGLAILGVARTLEYAQRMKGSHWIVSSIEHDAVLENFAEIERLGGTVTHIDPNEKGIITPESVRKALREETILVSIGWANSETGTVQPLRDIARALESHPSVLLHSDAGQAPLYIAPHVHTIGVDLFSLGSNKLYGPHGIGALYMSNSATLKSVMHGGKQERALRPGTENVALAAGFAAALEWAGRMREGERTRLKTLRDEFAKRIQTILPEVIFNGDRDRALPHFLNISLPNISSEYVALALDARGISVSTKSACREGEESRSHVIAALGGEAWRASNTLRFSFGIDTTPEDLHKTVAALAEAVRQNTKK